MDGANHRRSDHDELEYAWRKHFRAVVAYAVRRGFNQQDAEEIAAEAFSVAWRKAPVHQLELPWLLAVTRGIAANRRRSAMRRRRLFDRLLREPPPPAPSVDQDEGPVAEAFDALSESDRELLALIVWDGLKPRDAAIVLGASPAVVSVRLHRAKARLRKKVCEAGHQGSDRRVQDRTGRIRDIGEVNE